MAIRSSPIETGCGAPGELKKNASKWLRATLAARALQIAGLPMGLPSPVLSNYEDKELVAVLRDFLTLYGRGLAQMNEWV